MFDCSLSNKIQTVTWGYFMWKTPDITTCVQPQCLGWDKDGHFPSFLENNL